MDTIGSTAIDFAGRFWGRLAFHLLSLVGGLNFKIWKWTIYKFEVIINDWVQVAIFMWKYYCLWY